MGRGSEPIGNHLVHRVILWIVPLDIGCHAMSAAECLQKSPTEFEARLHVAQYGDIASMLKTGKVGARKAKCRRTVEAGPAFLSAPRLKKGVAKGRDEKCGGDPASRGCGARPWLENHAHHLRESNRGGHPKARYPRMQKAVFRHRMLKRQHCRNQHNPQQNGGAGTQVANGNDGEPKKHEHDQQPRRADVIISFQARPIGVEPRKKPMIGLIRIGRTQIPKEIEEPLRKSKPEQDWHDMSKKERAIILRPRCRSALAHAHPPDEKLHEYEEVGDVNEIMRRADGDFSISPCP